MSSRRSKSVGPRPTVPYAFGSSLPRDLSYLDVIPFKYRVYDVKFPRPPPKDGDEETVGPLAGDQRRGRSPLRAVRSSVERRNGHIYAFGSTTPREFSYLEGLEKELKIYNVRLHPMSATVQDRRSKTTTSFSCTTGDSGGGGLLRRSSSLNLLKQNDISTADSHSDKSAAQTPARQSRAPRAGRARVKQRRANSARPNSENEKSATIPEKKAKVPSAKPTRVQSLRQTPKPLKAPAADAVPVVGSSAATPDQTTTENQRAAAAEALVDSGVEDTEIVEAKDKDELLLVTKTYASEMVERAGSEVSGSSHSPAYSQSCSEVEERPQSVATDGGNSTEEERGEQFQAQECFKEDLPLIQQQEHDEKNVDEQLQRGESTPTSAAAPVLTLVHQHEPEPVKHVEPEAAESSSVPVEEEAAAELQPEEKEQETETEFDKELAEGDSSFVSVAPEPKTLLLEEDSASPQLPYELPASDHIESHYEPSDTGSLSDQQHMETQMFSDIENYPSPGVVAEMVEHFEEEQQQQFEAEQEEYEAEAEPEPAKQHQIDIDADQRQETTDEYHQAETVEASGSPQSFEEPKQDIHKVVDTEEHFQSEEASHPQVDLKEHDGERPVVTTTAKDESENTSVSAVGDREHIASQVDKDTSRQQYEEEIEEVEQEQPIILNAPDDHVDEQISLEPYKNDHCQSEDEFPTTELEQDDDGLEAEDTAAKAELIDHLTQDHFSVGNTVSSDQEAKKGAEDPKAKATTTEQCFAEEYTEDSDLVLFNNRVKRQTSDQEGPSKNDVIQSETAEAEYAETTALFSDPTVEKHQGDLTAEEAEEHVEQEESHHHYGDDDLEAHEPENQQHECIEDVVLTSENVPDDVDGSLQTQAHKEHAYEDYSSNESHNNENDNDVISSNESVIRKVEQTFAQASPEPETHSHSQPVHSAEPDEQEQEYSETGIAQPEKPVPEPTEDKDDMVADVNNTAPTCDEVTVDEQLRQLETVGDSLHDDERSSNSSAAGSVVHQGEDEEQVEAATPPVENINGRRESEVVIVLNEGKGELLEPNRQDDYDDDYANETFEPEQDEVEPKAPFVAKPLGEGTEETPVVEETVRNGEETTAAPATVESGRESITEEDTFHEDGLLAMKEKQEANELFLQRLRQQEDLARQIFLDNRRAADDGESDAHFVKVAATTGDDSEDADDELQRPTSMLRSTIGGNGALSIGATIDCTIPFQLSPRSDASDDEARQSGDASPLHTSDEFGEAESPRYSPALVETAKLVSNDLFRQQNQNNIDDFNCSHHHNSESNTNGSSVEHMLHMNGAAAKANQFSLASNNNDEPLSSYEQQSFYAANEDTSRGSMDNHSAFEQASMVMQSQNIIGDEGFNM